MSLPNPKFAPRRNDLPWLRRRRVSAAPAPAAPPVQATPTKAAPSASSGPPRSSSGKIDYTRRDRARPAASIPPTPTRAPDVTPRRAPDVTPQRAADLTRRDRPAAAATGGDPLDLSGPTSAPAPRATPPRRDPAPTGGGNPLDLSAPTAPTAPTPSPSGTGGDGLLDLSGPTPSPSGPSPSGGSTSLDLGGSPAPRPSSGPGGGSTSLDLGGGAPPSPPGPSSSTSLDLGGAGTPDATGGSSRAPRPAPAPPRHHVVRRTRPGAATLLEFTAPVVTLGRVQSGVGSLTFDAVVGDEVGDLRIGAAWALTDGRTGTVELDAGRKLGPDGRGAVVWAGREGRFERISVDLRQSRSLARLLLYGFSPGRQTIAWGGTVVVTTFGGDRVEAPIVSAPSPAVLALVSVYAVDGEFVIRSEMDPVAGSVRDTCRAFGYDRITWLDDRTPVT